MAPVSVPLLTGELTALVAIGPDTNFWVGASRLCRFFKAKVQFLLIHTLLQNIGNPNTRKQNDFRKTGRQLPIQLTD